MLGEVSPTLLCPKAPTKSARTLALSPDLSASCAAQDSRNCDATPLLSPLMRSLVLLMEVPCTGNHVSAPRPLQCKQLSVSFPGHISPSCTCVACYVYEVLPSVLLSSRCATTCK